MRDRTESDGWHVLDGALEHVIAREPAPLASLARKECAAVVVRLVYPPELCRTLVQRFYALDLLYDPNAAGMRPRRLNIGTALGWTKDDPDCYFAAAAAASDLFASLFGDLDSPIPALYGALASLAGGVPVVVAREPDGRAYGEAIVRAYHAGVGHVPHYDKLVDSTEHAFVVSRVREQLAVILCLQNADQDQGTRSQPILYNATGGPHWDASLAEGSFSALAAHGGLDTIEVPLEPGDLYVFRSSTIHAVPAVHGDRARIVLAAFLGLSENGDAFVVWS